MSTQERTPSLTTVDICYIHIHPDIQVRTMVSDDALERYTEIYKSGIVTLPPIKICISAETQEFFLIDGHHRLNAARAAGLKTISALDFGEMTLAEMISESIRSNCEQGLALSKADRKRAAEMLAKYNPQITVRDAAQRVGLSKSLVATVLKEYREKTVVQCSECKATVLRLFAEDSTNGWVQVPEAKRERWFCCEDHRRDFYAKQAEKEAERQAKREQDEEARNSELEFGSDNGSEPDNGPVRFYEHIPESQRDYDPKPCMDPHFKIKPCYKCGARAFYSHPDHYSYIVKCSNDECGYYNSEFTKDEALYTWNALYNVNQERDQHPLCPRCGSKPEMTIDHLHRERKFSVICPNIKCNFPDESHHETFPQDAWKYWDDVAFIETERSKEQEAENAKEPGCEPEIEENLKPCPFCGTAPHVIKLDDGFFIDCYNDECQLEISTETCKTIKEAAEIWNRRIGSEPERNPSRSPIPLDPDDVQVDHSSLLPCPFCGKDAQLFHTFPDEKGYLWYVTCGDLQCSVSPSTEYFKTQEEAIDTWNQQLSLESSNMFSKLLLKFLRIGYKWYAKDHDIMIRLLKSPEGEEMLFFDLETVGGCHHNGCYVIPNLLKIDFPTVPEEAEK